MDNMFLICEAIKKVKYEIHMVFLRLSINKRFMKENNKIDNPLKKTYCFAIDYILTCTDVIK